MWINILCISLTVLFAGGLIFSLVRGKKKGKSSCGGNCAGCTGCAGCGMGSAESE